MMRKIFGELGKFLKHPIGVILVTNAVWYLIVRVARIPFNIYINIFLTFVDLAVAYILFDRLIYFFSQFVLPIQNEKYREEIYTRVKNFETGSRGPAFFIKNGRVIKHKGEENKRGAGVIVLDTASAAVLRTDTELKETVGPGVVFTKTYQAKKAETGEYIAGSVDLRSQWQFIGPQTADQPFLNPVPTNPREYTDMQNRRHQTSGLTRDGFDISPTISIKFRIKRAKEIIPTESGVKSQYKFNADSVRNAITREVIELGTSENKKIRMEWNQLAAHLVVNIWREYIRKFKLDDLFTKSGISGLQIIEDRINNRVKKPYYEALNDTGKGTGESLESLEFKQLQWRGLEIIDVRIHKVMFDQDIEKQTIERWSTEWLNLAKKEEQSLKEKEALIGTASLDEASKTFARIASRQFSGKTTMPQQNQFKTLQLLIQPLKEYIVSESNANDQMEKEIRKLDEIWKWLLDNNTAENKPPFNRSANNTQGADQS